MEEENSERDHFEEVCRREEKAGKERLTLEQQLRVERRERQKQVTFFYHLIMNFTKKSLIFVVVERAPKSSFALR